MTILLTKRATDGPASDLSSAPLNLRKMSEKAQLALSMQGIADLDLEIVLLIDGSYSMHGHYRSYGANPSVVELLTDRVTAYAMVTDADKKVPLLPFDDKVRGLSRITRKPMILTPENAAGVVSRELFGGPRTIWPTAGSMGGTHLGKALDVAADLVEESGRFTQVIVIGDGHPNDALKATHATIRLGRSGAQVKFVSVVPLARVPWLGEVDNLETARPDIARDYDNVSSVEVLDPAGISDLAFFRVLTKELPEHIDRAIAAGRLAK